ncbi:MAG: hypothetical protein HQ518_20625 [Rhodopirellula sp.]|nr:hypothetical protein [Rhodopirellula sp.]
MNSAIHKTPGRFKLTRSMVSGIALCAAVMFLQGCQQKAVEPSGTDVTTEEPVVISLETTFEGLSPDEFEINVPRDLPTSDINGWGEEMLSEMVDPEVDEKQLAESLAKLLPGEVVERVLQPTFVLRDSNHLRDSLWAREVTESITSDSESEIDAIVDLFYFVINNIHVIPAAESLPFGPFESTLYGQGTTEDRAWVFATLLRQRRIPTVVFTGAAIDGEAATAETTGSPDQSNGDGEQSPKSENLIVGALLNDSIYLFDAGLGLPIASPDELDTDALVRKPATLAQALSGPSVLAKMGIGEASPYAITPELFRKLQPQVIGDSSVWSRRMEGLRNGQPVEVKALIFEALVSCGPFEGIIELVSAPLKKVLPDSHVGVWMYPERQREARESVSRNEEQAARLATLNNTFRVPEPLSAWMVKDDEHPDQPTLKLTFGASWGTHRQGRVDQILGRPERAIPAYLKVQNWKNLPPSPDDEQLDPGLKLLVAQQLPQDVKDRHLWAAEEALIWRASCQIQKGAYSSAGEDLEGYLRQLATETYPGRFRNEANYLAGISMALSGNARRGAAFLRKVDTQDSRYAASQWLSNRWTAQSEKSE